MLSGTRANIAIKLFGNDLSTLFHLGSQVQNAISDVKGLVDLSLEQQVEVPQIQIRANRTMLAAHGIDMGRFNDYIDIAYGGEKLADIYEGQMRFDLLLRLNQDYTETIDGIRSAPIDTEDGRTVPLEQVADIVSVTGPSSISRENVQRKIVVSANVADRDLHSVIADIRRELGAKVTLPQGYRIEYGGQFESEARASRTLLLTSILSLVIIFLLLFLEFRDFKLSTLILLNLPLALIGGVFSIYVTSGTLSIPAIIGFITLFGIATRNGILLISRYQEMEKGGASLEETVTRGSLDRLTPILMTALTSALALIPLVLQGDQSGNEIQSPMAQVILGGLLTSTLLNIYFIPVVYSLFRRQTTSPSEEA
jgi:Cu/Ag efflux pump CusA